MPPLPSTPPRKGEGIADSQRQAVAVRVDWWVLTDAELLDQCAEDRYRASGPGGQHRNKTDSAIRLRHLPSGLIVTATERRSQHENRRKAVARLREKLAYEVRQEWTPAAQQTLECAVQSAGRLPTQPRHPQFLLVAALLLDALADAEGRVSTVAERLGVPTGQIVRFFKTTPGLWQAAQHLRTQHGHKPLR